MSMAWIKLALMLMEEVQSLVLEVDSLQIIRSVNHLLQSNLTNQKETSSKQQTQQGTELESRVKEITLLKHYNSKLTKTTTCRWLLKRSISSKMSISRIRSMTIAKRNGSIWSRRRLRRILSKVSSNQSWTSLLIKRIPMKQWVKAWPISQVQELIWTIK